MLRYHLTWHMLSYFILSYPTMLRYHLVWCVLSYAPASWCKWSIYCCFGLILILFVFVWMRRFFCMSKYMQMILPFSYSLLMARFTPNGNSPRLAFGLPASDTNFNRTTQISLKKTFATNCFGKLCPENAVRNLRKKDTHIHRSWML